MFDACYDRGVMLHRSSSSPFFALLPLLVVVAPVRASDSVEPVPPESTTSAERTPVAADAACEEASYVLYVDDAAHVPCEGLFGTQEDRALFKSWRESYIHVVDPTGNAIDIVHGVSALEPPSVMAPAGMSFRGLRLASVREVPCDAEAGADERDHARGDATGDDTAGDTGAEGARDEWVAVFTLDDALAAHCPSPTVFLRVDDALGAAGRVLYVSSRGVLGVLGDQLVWFRAPGSPAPVFRMTWRSGFRVVMNDTSTGGASRSTTARKTPKRTSAKRKKIRPKRRR